MSSNLSIQSLDSWFQTDEACKFWQAQARSEGIDVRIGKARVVAQVVREPWPVGWFSRRAIVQGGPVFATENDLHLLLKQLTSATRHAIYTEIRCQTDYRPWQAVFEQHGYRYEPHLNILLPCDNAEAILERMSESHRRKVRQSQPLVDSGQLQLEYMAEESDLKHFYRLLRRHYLLKVRKPLPAYRYFSNLLKLPSAKLLLCRWQGHIIGGMVQIHHRDTVYDLYACALDKQYPQCNPSVMLYYRTMCLKASQGGGVFDTMGAGKPDIPYGVREFKRRFGGEMVGYGRFIRINKPFLYRLGRVFFVPLRRNGRKTSI
ncbi:MAG: GNAT family N-acetyltransferase [Paludibacteraceae bacterium]|nr:GNAT family N-acetyltransferase [Paludibacteraceae bacterium]